MTYTLYLVAFGRSMRASLDSSKPPLDLFAASFVWTIILYFRQAILIFSTANQSIVRSTLGYTELGRVLEILLAICFSLQPR